MKHFLFVLFFLALALCVNGQSCTCTCCNTNWSCTPINVGSVSVGDCSDCTTQLCAANFVQCSGSAYVESSCSSSGGGSSDPWSGEYDVQPGCNATSCCCPSGTLHIVQSGVSVSLSSAVTGPSRCSSTQSVQFTISDPGAALGSYTFANDSYSALLLAPLTR